MSKRKYYIQYVEGATPIVAEFADKKSAQKFIDDFYARNGTLDDKDSNFIENVFYGEKVDIKVKFLI